MMILVEKLRKFGDDVLVKIERSCEFVLCTLFCYETIPDFDLIDYLTTHGLLSIKLFEFMLWAQYLEYY